VYFALVFLAPAVMGYVVLVPLLIGLYVMLKEKFKTFRILLLFRIISASVILPEFVAI
jgi:hypothetical protein